jgi:hypothetical protein
MTPPEHKKLEHHWVSEPVFKDNLSTFGNSLKDNQVSLGWRSENPKTLRLLELGNGVARGHPARYPTVGRKRGTCGNTTCTFASSVV